MLNKAFLMGRLTRDPEMRHTQTGRPVCNFTVAVDRDFVPQGQERQTDFLNVVAWGSTAEFIGKYFAKGRMIVVEGRIETRTWDGNDGKKNYVTEIKADQVYFGEGKRDSDGGGYSGGNYGGGQSYSGGGNQYSSPPQTNNAMPAGLPDIGEDDFVPIDADDDLPF